MEGNIFSLSGSGFTEMVYFSGASLRKKSRGTVKISWISTGVNAVFDFIEIQRQQAAEVRMDDNIIGGYQVKQEPVWQIKLCPAKKAGQVMILVVMLNYSC